MPDALENSERAIANAALLAILDTDASRLKEMSGSDAPVAAFVQGLASDAGLRLESLDRDGREKLLERATATVSGLAIGSPRPHEVKAKLGSLGLLAPAEYKLKHADSLRNEIKYRGLRLLDAEDAVKRADAEQHLFPPGEFTDPPFLSLFVRLLNRKAVMDERAPASWCLVTGKREGQTLTLFNAWRVFQDDVDIDINHAAPLDLLKSLANTFGVEVVVGSTAGRKFILYERLPPGEPLLTAKVAQRFALEFLFRKTQDGGAEVAVAYGIDMARYRESLLRHKIDAPEMP